MILWLTIERRIDGNVFCSGGKILVHWFELLSAAFTLHAVVRLSCRLVCDTDVTYSLLYTFELVQHNLSGGRTERGGGDTLPWRMLR